MRLPRIITADLTPESRKALETALGKLSFSNKTLKPDQYLHHVTLAFKPNDQLIKNINVNDGEQIKGVAFERCKSDSFGVEAIKVKLTKDNNETVFCANVNPHITASTEGKPPNDSNKLLDFGDTLTDFQSIPINIPLTFVVKFTY